MPLKLGLVAAQVTEMVKTAKLRDQHVLLAQARQLLRDVAPTALRKRLEERTEASPKRVPWPAALPMDMEADSLAAAFSVPPVPTDFSVVAADGSAIPPDRHSPLRYYLINTGHAVLTYGFHPNANLDSNGCLYFEDELYIDPQGQRIPVDGARLSLKMQVEEMKALKEAASPTSRPAVALRDGSLIMWTLHGEVETVQSYFLRRFLGYLNQFKQALFPVASYISRPDGLDVAGALRVWLCQEDKQDCRRCSLAKEKRELCIYLGTVRDRNLFTDLLAEGERSQVFGSSSAILDKYREHRIRFFYLNVGGEIARIEAPAWVMDDAEMLDLLHSIVMDQCHRSGGFPPYPPALVEAHEQAVITTGDRRLVQEIVEREMAARGLTYMRSAKDRSKRTRAV